MMSLLRYFTFEPVMSFPNGIDLQEFGNKKVEHLSGVTGLGLKPMVKFVGEADFSESFTVVVIAVAAVVASATANT